MEGLLFLLGFTLPSPFSPSFSPAAAAKQPPVLPLFFFFFSDTFLPVGSALPAFVPLGWLSGPALFLLFLSFFDREVFTPLLALFLLFLGYFVFLSTTPPHFFAPFSPVSSRSVEWVIALAWVLRCR